MAIQYSWVVRRGSHVLSWRTFDLVAFHRKGYMIKSEDGLPLVQQLVIRRRIIKTVLSTIPAPKQKRTTNTLTVKRQNRESNSGQTL